MESSIINLMIGKYRVTSRIAQGSFGEIYIGLGPNNEQVAIKYEKHGAKHPQLRHEYKVYRLMVDCPGFCTAQHFGSKDDYNFMIIDLLGPSLEELFNKCHRRFSMKTIIQLADQMLERVDALHQRFLIHRDIKPANFVIGIHNRASQVFCVDFGLSKRYCDPKTMRHIFARHDRSLTGTPRYASINNHLGVEQSRRDDLESVAYILIYFIKGSLPWQGLKSNKPEHKYRLILQKKQQVSIAQLCQGCPPPFAEFLAYSRSLKFDAKPDIPYLRRMFRQLYHELGCGQIREYWDWDPLPGQSFCNCSLCIPSMAPPAQMAAPNGVPSLPQPGAPLGPSGAPQGMPGALPPAPTRQSVPAGLAPPMPPVAASRTSSAGAVRSGTRSQTAYTAASTDPAANHAPMDQEVIDVLLNLH